MSGEPGTTDVRLVTAHDVAKARTDAMPTDTLDQRIGKALAYCVELRRASEEKRRGEWRTSA